MTVQELRDMLAEAEPDARVVFSDLYSSSFGIVTGMAYDSTEVVLTNERD